MPAGAQKPPVTSGTFGKYEVLERVASGSSTELFKARHSGIGGFSRSLAIKRLLAHRNRDRDYVDGFVAEARRAGLLSHANIVQILDLGQVDGTWFVSMEYIDGPDLARVLARCRSKGITLPVPHAVFVCIETLKALEYAHSRQVMRGGRASALEAIHRNICPEKILLSVQGEVKLTDFANPSKSGHPAYRAPEQAAGRPTVKSDLYACGVVLYEMLTGKRPAETGGAPPSHVNPDVPYSLDAVLSAVLKPDPRMRFATATAMKRALDDFFYDAGFIFSHSTLASFLQGLFPDPKQRRRQPLGEAETMLHNRPVERPRPVVKPAPKPVPTPAPTPEPLGELPTRLDAAPVDMQKHFPIGESISRLTQPILEEAGEDQTLIESQVDMWDEAQTVIKRDPTRPPAEAAEESLEATRSAAPIAPPPPKLPPRAAPAPLARRAPPPRAMPEPTLTGAVATVAALPASSQRFLILFTAISVVAMVGMLFLGFFVGSHAAVVRPAQLALELPSGSKATLNGTPYDGGVLDLEGGRRHTLTVEPAPAGSP